MHALADSGLVNILATVSSNKYVDDNGANTWSPSENGKHIRLIEKMPHTHPGSVFN
jgi:hypothetical protein